MGLTPAVFYLGEGLVTRAGLDDLLLTQPSHSGTPYDPVDLLEYWSRSYGLVELRGDSDGVEYRLFRGDYNPSRLMLERLEAGEWEPPAEVPRELIISSLERQAEVEDRYDRAMGARKTTA